MNTRLLLSTIATASAIAAYAAIDPTLPSDSLVTFSESLTPSVALPDADGTYSTDRLTRMTLSEHGYVADSVQITGGAFRFYAPDTSVSDDPADWQMKWYSLAGYAVNPPLEYYLNPLYLASGYGTLNAIPLADGLYKIYYFDQKDNGQHYNLFTFESVGDEQEATFPPSMFLINAGNEAIEIMESEDTPGVYEADVTLPEPDFKISFQKQGYWIPGFIFGPSDITDSALTNGEKAAVEFGVNTWIPFTYSETATETPLAAGEEAHVLLDFSGPTNYITISKAGTTEIEDASTESKRPAAMFNLQGRHIDGGYKGLRVTLFNDGTSSLTLQR